MCVYTFTSHVANKVFNTHYLRAQTKEQRKGGTEIAPVGTMIPNFIYVTPFLDEVNRIKTALPELHFIEPSTNNSKGSKLESLKVLLNSGQNICTTHALFQKCDEEILDLLKKTNYILIVDEVIDVVEILDSYKFAKSDWELMLRNRIMKQENNWIGWNEELNYNGRLSDYKDLCYFNNVYQYKNEHYIWIFPVDILKAFSEIYILTYLFDGSLMKYYFDYYKIKYELKSVQVGQLVPYVGIGDTSQIKLLLDIHYDDKMNLIGEGRVKNRIDYTLSATHLLDKATEEELETLQKHIWNYFINITKSKTNEVIISTFKELFEKWTRKKAKLYRYRNSFIAVNSRATNE